MTNNPSLNEALPKQHVNFCNALPKSHSVLISANNALIASGVLFLFLIAMNVVHSRQNKKLETELSSLGGVKQQAAINLSQLTARYQEKEGQLKEFNEKTRAKKQIESMFAQALSKDREQYSRYFVLFSNLIGPTVWLTSIRIEGLSSAIELEGQAVDAKGVLQFVDSLNSQKLFINAPYKIIQLERPNIQTKEYSFTIKSIGA